MIETILVVEDEKMIRQGIAAMIKRSGTEVGEVLECPDGEKAFEILKNRHIDVVFTDIRMPKLNGIELVQKMQELDDVPLVVAISGYDDFSYAVEMLRHGVREYILKPVEREKLKQVMHKLDEEIVKKKNVESVTKNNANRLLKYMLLDKDAAPEEMDDLANLLTERVGEDYRVTVSLDDVAGAEGISIGNCGEIISIIPAAAAGMTVVSGIKGGHIGVSDCHRTVYELKEALKEAYARRRKAFLENIGSVEEDGKPAPARFVEDSRKLTDSSVISAAVQKLGVQGTNEVCRELQKFFVAAGRGYISPEDFEGAIMTFCKEYTSFYKREVPERIMHPFTADCLNTYTDIFIDFVTEAAAELRQDEGVSGSDRKMREAVAYIQANYMKELNMAVVSNEISMNYTLFSSEFKRFTGSNFVSYVRELRITEAKRLLSETDMRVNDIGLAVGYDNDKHFLKSFKAAVGVTPSEYRKNSDRKG